MKESKKFWILEEHQTYDEKAGTVDHYELYSDKEGYDLLWRAQEKDTLLNLFVFLTKKSAIEEYAARSKSAKLYDFS